MNTEDIILQVKRTFGDESGVQVTDDDIIRWINLAQIELVMHNETLLQEVDIQDLVKDQQSYDFPENLLVLRTIRFKPDNSVGYMHLKYYGLLDFDRKLENWDGTKSRMGNPAIYTTYNRQIFLYPVPSTNFPEGLKILYTRRPVPLTSSNDPIDLPEEYHPAVIKYCLAQANTQDEDYEAATLHMASVQSDIQRLSYREEKYAEESYPSITILPDDLW